MTAAAGYESVATELQRLFSGPVFRAYTSTNVAAVKIGGAVKNISSRLAFHRVAHPSTLYGLSGLWDLVLTCTGDLSRNRAVGLRLGWGRRSRTSSRP